MSFLSPIFNANYKHPLLKSDDPNRILPFGLRIKMILLKTEFWVSLFYFGSALTFVIATLLGTYFSKSIWEAGPLGFIICIVFPALVLLYTITSHRAVINEILLLKHGIVVEGKIDSTFEVNSSKETFYSVLIEFTTKKNELIKTSIITDQNKKQYEGRVYPIVYLPFNPSISVFMISLSRAKINLIYNQNS